MPPKPKLGNALRLRCPYCGVTALQEQGSYWRFVESCGHCQRVFDREDGYYSGVSWMISYPLSGIAAIAAAIVLFQWLGDAHTLAISFGIAAVAVLFSLATYPHAKALWIYFDHRMNPPPDSPGRR